MEKKIRFGEPTGSTGTPPSVPRPTIEEHERSEELNRLISALKEAEEWKQDHHWNDALEYYAEVRDQIEEATDRANCDWNSPVINTLHHADMTLGTISKLLSRIRARLDRRYKIEFSGFSADEIIADAARLLLFETSLNGSIAIPLDGDAGLRIREYDRGEPMYHSQE